MSQMLSAEAYDGFLDILDDAVALTKGALDLAESSSRQPAASTTPDIVLTKVASHVYTKTASALLRTGVFDGISQREMEQTLAEAGESGQLAILEKLASRAAFPISVRFGQNGELVERPGSSSSNTEGLPHHIAVWRTAIDEARREQG